MDFSPLFEESIVISEQQLILERSLKNFSLENSVKIVPLAGIQLENSFLCFLINSYWLFPLFVFAF